MKDFYMVGNWENFTILTVYVICYVKGRLLLLLKSWTKFAIGQKNERRLTGGEDFIRDKIN